MWHDRYVSPVGRSDQLAPWIGYGRATGFADQSSIPTGEDWRNQVGDLARRGVFIQLADFDLLDWSNQRQSLQEGAGAAGILCNEVIKSRGQLDQRGAELSNGIARCG
jgi:hypothetical protein